MSFIIKLKISPLYSRNNFLLKMTKHVPSPILRNESKPEQRTHLRKKKPNSGEGRPPVDFESLTWSKEMKIGLHW